MDKKFQEGIHLRVDSLPSWAFLGVQALQISHHDNQQIRHEDKPMRHDDKPIYGDDKLFLQVINLLYQKIWHEQAIMKWNKYLH